MNMIISGGGTGGHLYPALAIADEVMARGADNRVLFVGTNHGLESRVVPQYHYELKTIEVQGFKRKLSLENFRTIWNFFRALRQAGKIIDAFRPDVVVGTGGYVCGPVVWAAQRRGYPSLIQEQNSFPGITTRWLAKRADEIHLSFAGAADHLKNVDKRKIKVTGNPVKVKPGQTDKHKAYESFGLDARKKTVFIMGGSQGARSINATVLTTLAEFQDMDVQVLWQTGSKNYDYISGAIKPGAMKMVIKPYIEDMAQAYSITDVIVSRAGAMSLSEISLFGLPAVLIPLPAATADHQRKNAEAYVRQGAALMILEKELNSQVLAQAIRLLAADQERSRRMAQASLALAKPGAAGEIVDALYALARKKSPQLNK